MSKSIESFHNEDRVFPLINSFSNKSHIKSNKEYEDLYKYSIENNEEWWSNESKSILSWEKLWTKTLDWTNPPFVRWFVGGKINASQNCLDKHVESGKGDKIAIHWVGEPGDKRDISYSELLDETCKFANSLKSKNIKKGDRVIIYIPMVPEAIVAMLACARIGAIHSVVFAGFSSNSINDRLNDSEASAIITSDGAWRRGSIIPLKDNIDKALENYDKDVCVFVLNRCGNKIKMQEGRDFWWNEVISNSSNKCNAEAFDSEHPLFILYTSGSTGKPKGILHTTGGYLTGVGSTFKYVFDHKPEDIYWCTADVGWITGHSYIVYGPMLNGATQVIYEGAPNFPDWSRFWEVIETYKVNVFYTAPTAIRAFIKAGDSYVDKYNLDSLRLLGTVGEPINPEAWMWYYEKIGQKKCPIVDTWWQTETGAIMISPLPGATKLKPGSATRPLFGIDAVVLDEEGNECSINQGGKLVIRKPWPSMIRTIYKDQERFKETYWNDYENIYFTGDGARKDEDSYVWIMGRLDDVLNVSGHRLGTAEIESALVSHKYVAEAAVVGKEHTIKGESIIAFIILKDSIKTDDSTLKVLRDHVGDQIGAIAKPDEIKIVQSLPKTRSGKIIRRLLKEVISNKDIKGDISTLEDVSSIENLK